ncbi:helix-turn-helix domain-containing protein [Streptomyces sp. NPDC004732]|uniref:nSTAND1 domain-containing NTPase n=1 Tax=Streptomyces sp. NPDC004732 TaxID=3154290 RepID=UPI0033BAF192
MSDGNRETASDLRLNPSPETFGECLRRLRAERGMSLADLSRVAHYSRGYLSKVENGQKPPTADVARGCDEALGAGGALVALAPPPVGGQGREACPYPGLAAFGPGDVAWFFGRERATAALTARLAERLRVPGPVVVVGPSGAGKSSLLRAGLVPAVARGALPVPGSRSWPVVCFSPGAHPLDSLTAALAGVVRPDPTDSHGSPGPYAASVRAAALRTGGLVMIADQFEEVFTLCGAERERRRFIETLCSLAVPAEGPARPPVLVVIGVRADFYATCLEHPELVAALRDGQLPLGPMSRGELREAIEGPARRTGLALDPGLADLLLAELGVHEDDRPPPDAGALPLLAHALLATWQQRDGRDDRMSVDGYRLTGGIRGAVEATAERVYCRLAPAERTAARHLLLSMVRIGPGRQSTRRRVSREHLAALLPGADTTRRVVDAFADARLLTLDEEGAQLAHEALLSAWPRLRGWIDADGARLRDRQRLTEAAEAWASCGHDPAALYRGTQLALATEALAGTHTDRATPERRFLAAARAAEGRHTRRRRGARAALVVLTVLALLAGVTAWQQHRGRVQRDVEAASRRLASRAESLRYTHPAEAMRMSVAAWHLHPTPEAEAGLMAAAAQAEQDAFRPPSGEGNDEYHGAHLSADGRVVLTRDAAHVHVWDVVQHRRTARIRHHGRQIQDLSAGGGRLLLGKGGRSRVYDARSGRPMGPAFRSPHEPASFSPTGRHVVVNTLTSLRVLRADSGRVTRRIALTPYADVAEAVVGRDDRIMAFCRSGARDGPRALELRAAAGGPSSGAPVRLSAGDRRAVCGTEHLGHRIVLDPSGRFLASVGDDVRAWDLATGKSWLASPVGSSPAFSADGGFLVVTTDEEVILWRTADPRRPVYRHSLNGGTASQPRIDTEDRAIRYWEDGTTVRTLALGNALTSAWRRGTVAEAQYAPDGERLAVARRSGDRMDFELWPTGPGGPRRRIGSADCDLSGAGDVGPAERSCDVLMSFSADGNLLAHGIRARHDYTSRRHAQTVHVFDVRRMRERSRHVLARSGRREQDVVDLALTQDGGTLLLRRDTARRLDSLDLRAGADAAAPHVTFNSQAPGNSHLVVRPDGAFAADAGGLYRLPSGRRPARPPLQPQGAHRIAFSADGNLLAAGAHTGRVALWNGEGTRLIADLPGTFTVTGDGSGSPVTALAFSPDGTKLAVGDDGGRVALYDVPSSRLLVASLPTGGDLVRALAFTRDGSTVLTAGEHTPSLAYRIEHDYLVERVCARTGGGFSPADWEKHIPDAPYRRTCS